MFSQVSCLSTRGYVPHRPLDTPRKDTPTGHTLPPLEGTSLPDDTEYGKQAGGIYRTGKYSC